MKRMIACMMVLALCVVTLAAGLADTEEKPVLGRLTKLGVSEDELNEGVKHAFAHSAFSRFQYFDNFNSMIMALNSGTIAGMNIDEYMAEIAKRLGMNVELISVDSGARSISLASDDCDVVFWMEAGDFNNWDHADTEDQPENTIVTEPYLTCSMVNLVLETSPILDK